MNFEDWPWCEECQSYHHPSNTSCRKLKTEPKLDPLAVIKDVNESLELCKENLPPAVWASVAGYFHTTLTQVRKLAKELP